MSELKPSIRQMLEVAEAMDLTTLGQAYSNYTRHYNMFFLISDYNNQMSAIYNDIASMGWIDEDGFLFDELLIKDLLEELDK